MTEILLKGTLNHNLSIHSSRPTLQMISVYRLLTNSSVLGDNGTPSKYCQSDIGRATLSHCHVNDNGLTMPENI